MKKILSMDDLVKFCTENNLASFSAKKTGYSLAVHVPATFEVDDMKQKEMMRLKIYALHLGENRNGSYISPESADAALSSFAGRPILAHIHELDDGSFDFGAHEIIEEDGEVIYVEKQVGSFTDDMPFYEEKDGKTFVCTYGLIPTRYTKAAEIIEEKGGTKVSVELCIEEMAYDAKEKHIDLKQWYLTGTTLLGVDDDGNEIGEGMLGARADIVDFSEENNSVFARLDKIESVLSDLTIKSFGEGGKEAPMDDIKTVEAFKIQIGEDTRTFEQSLEEKANALYVLVNNAYGEADNEWYSTETFEDYVLMHGFFSGKHYKQGYEQTGDEFSLVGDRIEVYAEYLTQSEVDALNMMRATYDELVKFKSDTEEARENGERDAVLAEFEETLKDVSAYKELVENKAGFTVDDLRKECHALVGVKAMSEKAATFSATEDDSIGRVKYDFNAEPEDTPYGGIFET